jgi:hypothetical protein
MVVVVSKRTAGKTLTNNATDRGGSVAARRDATAAAAGAAVQPVALTQVTRARAPSSTVTVAVTLGKRRERSDLQYGTRVNATSWDSTMSYRDLSFFLNLAATEDVHDGYSCLAKKAWLMVVVAAAAAVVEASAAESAAAVVVEASAVVVVAAAAAAVVEEASAAAESAAAVVVEASAVVVAAAAVAAAAAAASAAEKRRDAKYDASDTHVDRSGHFPNPAQLSVRWWKSGNRRCGTRTPEAPSNTKQVSVQWVVGVKVESGVANTMSNSTLAASKAVL